MRSLPNEAPQQKSSSIVACAGASCLWRKKWRDDGLLDSALHALFQTFGGVDLYPDLLSKAARLGYGLIQNHPFVDGNKRIGTHVMLVFLSINGVSVEHEDADLINTILSIADGTCDEQNLLTWLHQHTSTQIE